MNKILDEIFNRNKDNPYYAYEDWYDDKGELFYTLSQSEEDYYKAEQKELEYEKENLPPEPDLWTSVEIPPRLEKKIAEFQRQDTKISGGVYIRKYEPDTLSCPWCAPNSGCNAAAKYKYKRNVSWKHKRKTQYK